MLTIEQIADKLKMNHHDVYGFLKFLKLLGAAKDELPPKSGKKGKPARLYSFAPNALDLIGRWIENVERESMAMQRSALEKAKADLDSELANLVKMAPPTAREILERAKAELDAKIGTMASAQGKDALARAKAAVDIKLASLVKLADMSQAEAETISPSVRH
jgi:predicted ArsR family transcriptional regulator